MKSLKDKLLNKEEKIKESPSFDLLREIFEQISENKKEITEDVRTLCQGFYDMQQKLKDYDQQIASHNYRIKKLEDRPTFNERRFASCNEIKYREVPKSYSGTKL